jgi:hypothetical protein
MLAKHSMPPGQLLPIDVPECLHALLTNLFP